ncbi:MAG: DUF3127 domain-containing protein [Cyclobacteriaceae bacterium]
MNIKGKLLEKFDTQQVTDSFRKREFVVEYVENPQFPEFIKFEMIQANCDQLDSISVGAELNIQFNLKGRKWTDPQGNVKYFNSLQAWRVEPGESSAAPDQDAPPASDNPEWINQSFSEDDDLPF